MTDLITNLLCLLSFCAHVFFYLLVGFCVIMLTLPCLTRYLFFYRSVYSGIVYCSTYLSSGVFSQTSFIVLHIFPAVCLVRHRLSFSISFQLCVYSDIVYCSAYLSSGALIQTSFIDLHIFLLVC